MTKALPEAIQKRPPRGGGTGEVGAVSSIATNAAGTTAQALGLPVNGSGAFFTFICTQNALIRFGVAGLGAAGGADWPLFAGVAEEFWCESNEDTHFRAIRNGAVDGTLYWFRSSR